MRMPEWIPVCWTRYSDSRPGGTGRSIEWGLARRIRDKVRLPVILAGGLDAGNIGKAIEAVNPYGVDVISGVENQEERKKDPQKVRAFVKAVVDAQPVLSSTFNENCYENFTSKKVTVPETHLDTTSVSYIITE